MHNSNLQHILKIFSDELCIDLVKIIANDDCTPDFIRKKMNVTKKDLNAIMDGLVPLGIVDMINDQYELTRLGKEIFESLMMIEDAIKIYYRLDTIDNFEGRGEEEIIKLIDIMEFKKGVKQLIKQTIARKRFNPKV